MKSFITGTERTWTLKGKVSRLGIARIMDPSGKALMLELTDSTQMPTRKAFRLNQVNRAASIAEMHVHEIVLRGEEDWEVLEWLDDNCRGQVDILFEEVPRQDGAMPGTVLEFHFRFHDIDDALKFKLTFAEGLETNA